MRPDAVRAGDVETERLLARAFRAGFYESGEGINGEYGVPSDAVLREMFAEWRRGLLTRKAPLLSLSQINWLIAAAMVRPVGMPDDVGAVDALCALRTQDDQGGRRWTLSCDAADAART